LITIDNPPKPVIAASDDSQEVLVNWWLNGSSPATCSAARLDVLIIAEMYPDLVEDVTSTEVPVERQA